MSKKEKMKPQNQMLQSQQKKYFIQTLEIKEDTNIMRIYSVVCPSDFFSLAKIKSTTL